ncbi:MAG TPA: diacylglycerol kinase family protein [Pyrinomonadaceae bacterium]|jgi:YegS/Rv2252/BmrU family lipid kinase|nr:diacylglycerol kinase family protein [Pyrinomonadaceae bacterium]
MSLLPLVIVNPASANGATRTLWPSLASELRTHFGPFGCAFTERAGDGRALAARAAAAGGSRLIIACGGDGTVNEVANGILEAGRASELGLLPSGTGGDFRRSLGIPARAAEAARTLRRGRTRLMDVGRVTYVNHEGETETRYFLGVASFGMSPEVIERVKEGGPSSWLPESRARRLSGRVSFAVATLKTTLSSPRTTVSVQLDDHAERRLTVANLCVANARYFGGGMKIAPRAVLDDGRFDIITIGDLGALRILANAPRLYLGTHLSMEQVNHAYAARVEARPVPKEARVAIEVDGELPGRLPATFEILPSALRVRAQ